MPDAISWGDTRIAAVIDWVGEVPDAIGLLPGTSRADREQHRGWLSGTQADIWSGTHQLGRRLTLHSAPGHTPGSSVLVVSCDGRTAVFTGDLFHSPLQIIEPHWASCYDEEARAAEVSRRQVLSLAADTAALVLPAHLARARALLIDRHGAGFQIARWFLPDAEEP